MSYTPSNSMDLLTGGLGGSPSSLTGGESLPPPSQILTGGLAAPAPTQEFSSLESSGRSLSPNLLQGISDSQNSAQTPTATLPYISSHDSLASASALGLSQLPSALKDIELAEIEAGNHVFAGADMRVYLELPGKKLRQLIELTTVTVSVHREKSPARACGYINAKGYARGRRTIAGTIILTQFQADFMLRFLGQINTKDESKDTQILKVDQLPPFNLYLYFGDEYGSQSYRHILGVDLVTDGTVHSAQDMYSERTISYVASDFTPLLPVEAKSTTAPSDPRLAAVEKTPKDMVTSNITFL